MDTWRVVGKDLKEDDMEIPPPIPDTAPPAEDVYRTTSVKSLMSNSKKQETQNGDTGLKAEEPCLKKEESKSVCTSPDIKETVADLINLDTEDEKPKLEKSLNKSTVKEDTAEPLESISSTVKQKSATNELEHMPQDKVDSSSDKSEPTVKDQPKSSINNSTDQESSATSNCVDESKATEKDSLRKRILESKATEKDSPCAESPSYENFFESEPKKHRDNDSGDETADTDKEEEEYQNRVIESKKKGTKLVHRASFKRDKFDRHYDRLPWVVGATSRLLGLKLAPINLPIHRRMETLAVFLWMCTFLFLGMSAVALLSYLFLYTQYWWVSLCYVCFYIPDRTVCNRGGRRWIWFRNMPMWRHFRNFFPVTMIPTAELSTDRNYIMCYHPHGILCAGAYCAFSTEGTGFSKMFPGLTPYMLTLEVLFLIPFYRELFLLTGAVSATRASMDHLLGKEGTGRALCLVVGGAPESLDCHPNKAILHLEQRKGFIKMALRHGASLVPMFGFGENDVYDQIPNSKGTMLRRVQDYLQSIFGIAPCFFMGRGVFQYSLGFVPYRKPIYIVVGAPLHVDPVHHPTSEQILALHNRYKKAIVDLYNDHKDQYARDPSVPIEIV